MEKLELKHLAHYLPYRLKVKNENRTYKIITINGFYFSNSELMLNSIELNGGVSSKEIKPILRPLSEIKNKEYCELTDNYFISFDNTEGFMIKRINETYTRLNELDYLFKNHFDVFGLISKKLAIDINTLKDE